MLKEKELETIRLDSQFQDEKFEAHACERAAGMMVRNDIQKCAEVYLRLNSSCLGGWYFLIYLVTYTEQCVIQFIF